MFDAQSTNATATFLTDESGSWEPSIQDVRVLYEPQGTSYVHHATGDVVQREERILGPLSLDQHVDDGDRVTMTYLTNVYQWRVTNFRARSLDGVEGYCQMELEDYGDEHTDPGGDGGGDDTGSGSDDYWDIG